MDIGIAIWKCRTKRHQRVKAPDAFNTAIIETEHFTDEHIDLENVAIYMEKPHIHAGWTPQIRSQHGSGAVDAFSSESVPSDKNNRSLSRHLQVTMTSLSEDSYEVKYPPPSNPLPNTNQPFIHIPSPPIVSPPTPPTPLAARKLQVDTTSLGVEAQQVPIPSPRSHSFITHELVIPNQGPSDELSEDKNFGHPRVMTVATAFIPNLADELSVEVGELVRMLDEYGDGWCLVQRIGNFDAPKGVVPRFCLHER
jgi:Variant SH3 domain